MFEGAVKGTGTKSSDTEVTKKSFAGKKANFASEERLDNVEDSLYNENTNNSNDYNAEGGITNGNEDEFRRIQEEARKEFARSDKEQRIYAKDNEALRKRLTRVLSRRLDDSGYNSGSDLALHLKSDKQNTEFLMYENVDAETLYEIFEIARAFTENGELVDLHGIESSDDGFGYNDCYNYLSEDGLSGFSNTIGGKRKDKTLLSHQQ